MDETTDDSWFWDSIGIDPSTTSDWSNADSPSNAEILQEIGYEDPGVISTVSNFLKSAGTGALNFLKGQFTDPKTGAINWRNASIWTSGS